MQGPALHVALTFITVPNKRHLALIGLAKRIYKLVFVRGLVLGLQKEERKKSYKVGLLSLQAPRCSVFPHNLQSLCDSGVSSVWMVQQ